MHIYEKASLPTDNEAYFVYVFNMRFNKYLFYSK